LFRGSAASTPELALGPAYRLPASIVEYRRAPESKPLRRQADTRRAVLVRPIQFSKNRPGPFGPPLSRARPSKRTRTPLGGGPRNRRFDRLQGNLTTLLRRFVAVNPLPRRCRFGEPHARFQQSSRQVRCWNLPSWCPTWEPENPGTWGHPPLPNGRQRLTNAEGENSYYAPRVGLSTLFGHRCSKAISLPSPVAPNPGARHATTASHTAGQ